MVYENIVELCEKRGLTIRQLEIKAGVGNGVVGKFRNCKYPRYDTIQKLSKVLGVKPETLMKDETTHCN